MSDKITRSRAWVLGPRAENQEFLEELLTEVIRDHCYWRKNFHPEDRPFVDAEVRASPGFRDYQESLRDTLFQVLSRLKQSVPFFSPRYLGHMNSDLLVAGVVGYVGAMMYNQNNIVQEAGTITVKLEQEAVRAILTMLGYATGKDHGWGHLCSGGTVANLESLWVARNVRLLPHQLALLTADEEVPSEIRKRISTLPVADDTALGDLLEKGHLDSLSTEAILELLGGLQSLGMDDPRVLVHAERLSVRRLGYGRFLLKCRDILADRAPGTFRIILSKNAHYSLLKAGDVLGLGKDCFELVDLDRHFRLDIAKAREAAERILAQGDQLLALVGVHGSTEEGTIDSFDELVKLRAHLVESHGAGFWLHADACYGGYSLAMARPTASAEKIVELQREVVSIHEDRYRFDGLAWGRDEAESWLARSLPIAEADSISLDPHKLGYLPYPAGATLYRNAGVRGLVQAKVPYLDAAPAGASDQWDTDYLGAYTLEGSRPGAVSVAVWLAHSSVPLDRTGHGVIVAESILGARYLRRVLTNRLDGRRGVKVFFLGEDLDLNILCYSFAIELRGDQMPIRLVNEVVKRLYHRLLPSETNHTQKRDFVIAKTSLSYDEYGPALEAMLADAGVPGSLVATGAGNPWADDTEVVVARTVVMGASLLGARTRVARPNETIPLVEVFADHLEEEVTRIAEEVASLPSCAFLSGNELHLDGDILVIEDDLATRRAITAQVERACLVAPGRCILQADSLKKAMALLERHDVTAALVDVVLQDDVEGGIKFLESACSSPGFRGGVVFAAAPREGDENLLRERIVAVRGQRQDWHIEFHAKPDPNSDRFQAACNGLLRSLWDVVHRGPPV